MALPTASCAEPRSNPPLWGAGQRSGRLNVGEAMPPSGAVRQGRSIEKGRARRDRTSLVASDGILLASALVAILTSP